MPHSQYVAGREPPSKVDRYLFHMYSLPLGIAALLVAPLMFVSAFTDIVVSRSLSEAPTWLVVGIGGALLIGAPVFLTGMLKPRWTRLGDLTAMIVAMAGAILLASGSLAFAFGIIGAGNAFGTVTAIYTLAVGIGHLNCAIALFLSEKRGRAKLEADRALRG